MAIPAPVTVVHVIGTLSRGGAEAVIYMQSTGVHALDPAFRFRLAALYDTDDYAKEFESAGIPVDAVGGDRRAPVRTLVRTMQYLRRHTPLIVHTHLSFGDRFGQTASFLTRTGARVSTLHNVKQDRTLFERMTNRVTGVLAHAIVAVSESARREWVENRGMPARRTRVIYNAPSFDAPVPKRPKLFCPGNGVRCVCLGNLRPVKGHRYAIEAMAGVCRELPGSTLHIFGADPDGYGKELERLIVASGLNGQVFLEGPAVMPQDVLPQGDIVLMPSLSEGFPLVPVEALSLGVPIVASDIPVHREILGDGRWGVLVEKQDPGALAAAILRMARDRELHARLSLDGYERARYFGRDRMVAQYLALYRALLSGADRRIPSGRRGDSA
jgi:glycosyltransferase involved in cell wall biosynthesis